MRSLEDEGGLEIIPDEPLRLTLLRQVQAWNSLEDKSKFEEIAARDQARYEKEMIDYEASLKASEKKRVADK